MRPTHHGLKLGLPLLIAGTITTDIARIHWSINITSWLLLGLGTVFAALGAVHAYLAPCPTCRTRTLPRPLDRTATTISRYTGWPLALCALLAALLLPVVPGDASEHFADTRFNWGQEIPRWLLVLLFTGFMAAVRYDRVNHPDVPRKTPLTRFLKERGKALVHKGHWFYAGTAALAAGALFLPTKGIWGSIGNFLFLLTLFMQYTNAQHGKNLCEQCVTEFRADAAEHAEQRRWKFAAVHKVDPWAVALGLAYMLGVLLLPHLWKGVIGCAYFLLVGFMALQIRFHSSYRPWCPYCRRGGGSGDEETESTPDPSQGRPVPA